MNEPNGAQALLIALNTPTPQGGVGIPVILWGKPGVGKSSYIESLGTETTKVLTLIASIHDPTDFSGLPVFDEGKVKYAIPEWVEMFDKCEKGVLFLDELSTAPPSVQAALLRVVLERKVGFHNLPEQVRIVAAANPPDLMVGGWELSPPLRNRFVHLNWDIEASTYINALHEGWAKAKLPEIDKKKHALFVESWKLKIVAFLKLSPEAISSPPDNNPYAFASPRSWDFVACLLASCELLGFTPTSNNTSSKVAIELVKGCIGEDIAFPFIEFLRNINLPDPEKVLDRDTVFDIKKLNDSEVYIFFGAMNNILMQRLESTQLLSSMLVYMELTQTLVSDGRRDLIYIPLKEISKKGIWVKTLALSQTSTSNEAEAYMPMLTKLFSDEGLKEYIDVFNN